MSKKIAYPLFNKGQLTFRIGGVGGPLPNTAASDRDLLLLPGC
jgi:hypothetical protein